MTIAILRNDDCTHLTGRSGIRTKARIGIIVFILMIFSSCSRPHNRNQYMIDLLAAAAKRSDNPNNVFAPAAVLRRADSVISASPSVQTSFQAWIDKGNAYLELGKEEEAVNTFENLLRQLSSLDFNRRSIAMKDLAVSYMRLGERTNCILNHNSQSCIFPISAGAVHVDKTGSEKAIELYKQILFDNPADLESRWLLNIAYMTTGGYPDQVPPAFLLPLSNDDSTHLIKAFEDIAMSLGVNTTSMAGGAIVDDFNNDDYPDLVVSSWGLRESMHYFRNNRNGTFSDLSDSSGLADLTGGLNMMQTDYNNDGLKDIFVLRGAWKMEFGDIPNSLLRNNGDGSFTDVTRDAHLLSFHPTQTTSWADFNNDGWLDLFIGNETSPSGAKNPCELYMNNRDGTFTEEAAKAGCAITKFVKGVTTGDYDNDGRSDIFISTFDGNKFLLHNVTGAGGSVHFEDVTTAAGLNRNKARSFTTWFWDYDNDGWPDLLLCGYSFYEPLASYAAAELIHASRGDAGKVFLFHNNHDGTFSDLSGETGLDKVAFAMGGNFGDIDNDGYPDFYLGTGNPQFKSLIPNKLFLNRDGNRFVDVTNSSRVGNLQKGHGVAFADVDNDGNEDIFIEMGGAYPGDAYANALYHNPGQHHNNWLNVELRGVHSNRLAIGARIKVSFSEDGQERSVYRTVNSGGSFGANPLRQHIGVGSATRVSSVEVTWPATGKTQRFDKISINSCVRITEGNPNLVSYKLPKLTFDKSRMHMH